MTWEQYHQGDLTFGMPADPSSTVSISHMYSSNYQHVHWLMMPINILHHIFHQYAHQYACNLGFT
jgi:hypothetical protein